MVKVVVFALYERESFHAGLGTRCHALKREKEISFSASIVPAVFMGHHLCNIVEKAVPNYSETLDSRNLHQFLVEGDVVRNCIRRCGCSMLR